MSEYRIPEEDTIGRHGGEAEERREDGPPAESGEKPAGAPSREGQTTEDPES